MRVSVRLTGFILLLTLRLLQIRERKTLPLLVSRRVTSGSSFRNEKGLMARMPLSGWVQWFMPVLPALSEAEAGELQGEEFKTSLTNMVKRCLY